MAERRTQDSPHRVPSGFAPGSGGRASEYAREQGWQTNEEERTRTPEQKQPIDGGADYDYGARDFGDLPADTSSATPASRSGRKTIASVPSGAHRQPKQAGEHKAAGSAHGAREERKKKTA